MLSSAGPEGTVYAFRPGAPHDEFTLIHSQASAPRPGAAAVLPITFWVDGEFADQLDPDTYEYTTLAEMVRARRGDRHGEALCLSRWEPVPAGAACLSPGADGSYPGMDETGWRWSHNLDTYSFVTALPGKRIYVVSGAENRTYSATVEGDGTLSGLQLFAERGGESVAVDAAGNVYVANGQIFVFDQAGKPVGEIQVPERPTGLFFGGPDRRTLFILTHRTLYAVKTRHPGRVFTWGT